MIALKLQGRLGNQLFEYAFIYCISKKLKTSFYLDRSSYKFILPKYFTIEDSVLSGLDDTIFSIRGYKNLFNFHLKIIFYKSFAILFRLKKKVIDDYKSAPLLLDRHSNQTLYEGFYQSPQHFIGYETEIRKMFTIKPVYTSSFKDKYGQLYNSRKTVCIHLRKTDYYDLEHLGLGAADLTLPLSYYYNALAQINTTNLHYIFIGDDYEFIKKNFEEIKDKTVTQDSEISDLQHLIHADYCIISNSTFSWWGAWLNNKPNKIIYSPRYFMGWRLKEQIPPAIYPAGWITIDEE